MGKKGFSTVEMIIVVILIGVTASIGFPRLNTKALLATMVATARGTAIQRGCVATLNLATDSVWVTACGVTGNPPPASVVVGTAKRVKADVNITLNSSAPTIRYDPRGMRLTFQATTVRVIGPTYQDSVVINELGKVKRQ